MTSLARIYLDNAATSWPKPDVVYDAIDRYQRNIGASAGRSGYTNAQLAQRIIAQTRSTCARLLGVADPACIAFTANGTDALNLAIHGLLRRGDHVVTTVCEHNSVLRPLAAQVERNDVTVSFAACDAEGFVTPGEVARLLRPNTRLVGVTHASNVTGAIQPVAQIAAVAHAQGAMLLVDAAQTAGSIAIDVGELGVDLLATGGHKGLLGPLGTAILYVRPGIEREIATLRQGGTGTGSKSDSHPGEMPERLEAGNLNVPALAGLGAAAAYLQNVSVAAVHQRLAERTEQLLRELAAISGVTIFGPTVGQSRVAVVSFAARGYDPQELAAALDVSCGVECRAGLHCAPRMHTALGTSEMGGLVRLSPGWSTTGEEIEQALAAVKMLVAGG